MAEPGQESRRREERRRRVAASERGERIGSLAKVVGLPLLALLLVVGVGFAIKASWSRGGDCPTHEHATFKVAVRDEFLSFQHPRFDMRSMGMRTHLHQPDDSKVHLEGGCASVAAFFRSLGMTLEKDRLELDMELHGGEVLADEGNETLRFFLFTLEQNWTEKPDLPSYQLRDGDRTLVTYGNHTEEQIATIQARVPAP